MNPQSLLAACLISAPLMPSATAQTPATQTPAAQPSQTQPAPQKAPTSWRPARVFDAAALSLRALPNGVRGLVRETRGTGLVSLQVWVRAGGRYESEAENGSSRLLESLALRASKAYPRGATDWSGGPGDAIEALGGVVTSQTSRDATFYSATVDARVLPQAMQALSDAVLRPYLSAPAIESAKIEVQNELLRRESDPLQAAADISYRSAFAKHPYRKPPGGTALGIENLTPVRVRAFHAARYVGRNISVVVAGDVRRNDAHKLIAKYFAAARSATGKAPVIAPEKAPSNFKSVPRKRPINRTAVALAFASPGIANKNDVVAMDVLLAHWREGSGAVLRTALLGPEPDLSLASGDAATALPSGPALAFDVDYLTQRDPGLFVISLVVEPTNRDAAIAATLRQIEIVQRDGISADDLARAKRALSQQYIAQDETVSGQAGALGFYDMIDTYKFAVEYLDRIARITPNDVKGVATKYLSRTRYIQTSIESSPREREPSPTPGRGTITASLSIAQRDASIKLTRRRSEVRNERSVGGQVHRLVVWTLTR